MFLSGLGLLHFKIWQGPDPELAPLGCDPYSLSNHDPHTLGHHGNRIQAPCTCLFNESIDPETELHCMCNEAFICYDEVHGNSSREDDILEEVHQFVFDMPKLYVGSCVMHAYKLLSKKKPNAIDRLLVTNNVCFLKFLRL